jgi:[acyl-carrier-protein] S-malonyltransferase
MGVLDGLRGVCVLFPGQGSQSVGMGRALAGAYPEAEECFAEASEVLGFDLRALCWNGPAGELAETENAQPALLTASVAAWRVLQRHGGLRLAAAAGHSVGGVAALVAAGRLAFGDAVRLIRLRGELMASAPGRGGMCAVAAHGPERELALAAVRRHGLDLAADNTPRQFTASGPVDAVEAFVAEQGARVKRLDVSHAFHSRMMRPVEAEWRAAVREAGIGSGTVPVGLVAGGRFALGAEELGRDLADALCAPVRWRGLMEEVIAAGPPLVAAGPAKPLVGMAKHFPERPGVLLADTPGAVGAVLRRLEQWVDGGGRKAGGSGELTLVAGG